MSKLIVTTLAAAVLAGSTMLASAQERVVNVYNWSDYIDPTILADFTKETGITTNVLFLDKGLVERIQAEGANSPADVILTVDISRLTEAKEELFNLRFQMATGQLSNNRRLGVVKRDIARIYTVMRERELGIGESK